MREVREEEDFNTIQDISRTSTSTTTSMASSNSTSYSSWSRFKDPRIVWVSRAFGGKDRHSKVCTVRGLRDRRVRLSVPTAIQLYDLQDRLGLNQPSKVVDWLINVAKHEIDELPPLRFPDGRFGHNLHHDPAFLEFGGSQSIKEGLKISGSEVYWDDPKKYTKSDVFWGKSKDVPGGKVSIETGIGKEIKRKGNPTSKTRVHLLFQLQTTFFLSQIPLHCRFFLTVIHIIIKFSCGILPI